MGTITYTGRLQPGQVATGAALDTRFSAITSAYSSLTKDNFRRFAGIGIDSRDAYHSVLVGGLNIPTLTYTESDVLNYYSIFSYPHSVAIDPATTKADIDLGNVQFVPTFRIKQAQIMWDSVTSHNDGDIIRLVVVFSRAGAKVSGFGSAGNAAGGGVGAVGDNTIATASYTVTDAIACHAYLNIDAYTGSSGTRTINNLSAWVTLEVPHV